MSKGTVSLDKILAYAQSQGSSLILSSLLPGGFECYPVESRETRMERVLAFALEQERSYDPFGLAVESQVKEFTREVRGKEEVVRPHESMEHGWAHPDAIGGHKVLGVFTHPRTGNSLADLGHGLHAEGVPQEGGKFKYGAVMRSNTGLDRAALAEKGWKYSRPPKPPKAAAPAAGAAGEPGKGGEGPLAKVTRAAGKEPGRGGPKLRTGKGAAKAKAARAGVAEQQREYMARAGYKIDPHDWEQDWVPPHEDRITPDFGPVSEDVKDLTKAGRPLGVAEGTASDPIDVKGDTKEALRQLAQGKHVRLNKPTELTLLMQEVARHAAETEAAGKNEKPDWDFGKLSVKGTNLFAAQNKGIRRIHMPQFSGLAQPGTHAAQVAGGPGKFADLTDEFEQYLKDHGHDVTRTTVPAGRLKATQTELSGAKVAGFANAFLHGNPKAVKAMSEPIMVTRDGYVVDGHHRWAANMLIDAVDGRLNSDAPMNVRRVNMDIGAMIPLANEWAQRNGIGSAALGQGGNPLDKAKGEAKAAGEKAAEPEKEAKAAGEKAAEPEAA
jgi:hypothetical protein